MKKFFEKPFNFQECDYHFGADFLTSIFGEKKYMRKYSKVGDGIYNLLFIDNKIYELKLKNVNNMLTNDNKKAFRDTTKDYIVDNIINQLKLNNIEATTQDGKFITFKYFDYIIKVEIVKKNSIPE